MVLQGNTSISSPTEISNLQLWLDATNVDESNNSTLSSGDSVSTWKDLSGNGNHMNLINSNHKPTLATQDVNSKDVVVFSLDGMKTQQAIAVQSILLVHETQNRNYFLDFRNGVAESYLWFARLGPFWTHHTKNGIQMQQMAAAHIFNDQLQISYFSGNSSGSGTFFLHSRYSNNEFGSGKIAEVLVYDRTLTETELNQGELYLANKWGLSAIVDSDGDGAVDASDGDPLDPSSQTNLATVTGTVSYDGVIDGPAIVWALEANGSAAATQTLANGNGNFSLTVEKSRGYDFKVFVDGTGDGYPQGYEVWKHHEDWNNTLGGFNLTQVDGNLSGVNFNLFDIDSDGDGFVNWHEYQAGSEMNDANSTPGLDFGLVGYWPFDGNASDLSGNGNHGTVHGATLGTDRNGQGGKAFTFDGINDYLEVPYFAGLSSPKFSFSLWANPNSSNSAYGSPLTARDTSPENGYLLYKSITNEWEVWMGDGGYPWNVSTLGEISVNQWVSITCTYDSSNVSLYLNGTEVTSNPSGFLPITNKP